MTKYRLQGGLLVTDTGTEEKDLLITGAAIIPPFTALILN